MLYKANKGHIFENVKTDNKFEKFYLLVAFKIEEKIYACLISTGDGNRWDEPIEVPSFSFDEEGIKKLIGYPYYAEFKYKGKIIDLINNKNYPFIS